MEIKKDRRKSCNIFSDSILISKTSWRLFMSLITVHTIVKNEERFIKAALVSALALKDVGRAFVWDTGSSDRTVQEILSIKDSRIEFIQKGNVSRKQLVLLREEQLRMTESPWILLVDGDEIWPEKNLDFLVSTMKQCSNPPATPARSAGGRGEIIALVCRTRNVVGDIYHYLPESEGHYRIGQWRGHLNIRAIQNLPGLTVKGEYPNEWYELDGKKIQEYPKCMKRSDLPYARSDLKRRTYYCLKFVDTWYLHATHLTRSSNWVSEMLTIDRLKKHKWFWKIRRIKLLTMGQSELPEALI